MRTLRKIIFFTLFTILIFEKVTAESPHYIDFKYILNQSEAGKKAQNFLKSKLEKGIKNLQDREKKIQDEEKQIIQKKKLITADEYKKKVVDLRKKVSKLQKERNTLLETVAKDRAKARNILLKNLNPIVKDYMNENKIRMVIDKKNLLLADEQLDITNQIMSLLNKKLKSISLN